MEEPQGVPQRLNTMGALFLAAAVVATVVGGFAAAGFNDLTGGEGNAGPDIGIATGVATFAILGAVILAWSSLQRRTRR